MRRLLPLVLLAGCVDLSKEYPERKYHDLQARRTASPNTPAAGTVLKVRRFRVSARYDHNEFVYRKSAQEYETDFHHVWFVAPAQMLTEEARRWLGEARVFEHVVDFSSHLDATHVLEGSVTALYADYAEATEPKAVMEVQFFLLDDVSSPPVVVFQGDYRREVKLVAAEPARLVTCWNSALTQILIALEDDLRKLNLKK
jgi:cholesterol transport system auxiliary component